MIIISRHDSLQVSTMQLHAYTPYISYKMHAKYNIKHNIAAKCEHNVLKTGRSSVAS